MTCGGDRGWSYNHDALAQRAGIELGRFMALKRAYQVFVVNFMCFSCMRYLGPNISSCASTAVFSEVFDTGVFSGLKHPY